MIHSSVVIENGAKIAQDVVIGPFCHIGKDVTIAEGSRLESNIILKGKIDIASKVKIFSFVSMGDDNSEITVGEKTHIREFSQIGTQDNENAANNKIIIGANNFIMGYVQLQKGVELSDFCILTNAVRVQENVTCAERVIIGGLSTVEANCNIGTGVMIGGASCVETDLPPFTLVEGNKATVKGLNVVGLRRRLENSEDMDEIKSVFKRILGDVVDKELAQEIANTHKNEYVQRFAAFVATSNL